MSSKRRCFIFGCDSSKLDNVTFHSFPANKELNLKWRRSIHDKASLEDLTDYSLICSRHFEENCFYFTTHKHLLKKGAIPTIFHPTNHVDAIDDFIQDSDDPMQEPAILFTPVPLNNKSTQTLSNQPLVQNLKYKIKILSLKLKRLQTKYNAVQEKLQNEKEKSKNSDYNLMKIIKKIKYDAENMDPKAIFIMDQIHNYNKLTPKWSEMTIRQCITWRFCSPKGYQYPRNAFLRLPCKSTLKKYLATGDTELIKNRLLSESRNLNSFEKLCSLIVDDMAVKERVCFSKSEDRIFGLDYQENIVGHNPSIANQLLCFVIHGLSTRYIIPASYHFHRQLNSQDLHKLTLNVLELLTNCGFVVIRIVGDNHKSNTAMFRRFGNGKLLNSIPHPFCPGFRLFFSFDYCHLVKNARNNFLDHDMVSSDGIISVRFLRRKHLFPSNFDKMKVYPAVQIFSPPVTAALKYLSVHGGMELDSFKSCLPTVTYMENMYKYFQIHDVSNKTQHIHCRDPNTAPYVDLNDARLLWQCVQYLIKDQNFYYVLTRCFSSDAVEAMFSHVRLSGGSNDLTDCRAAEHAIKQILRCGLIVSSTSSNIIHNINYTSNTRLEQNQGNSYQQNHVITITLDDSNIRQLELLATYNKPCLLGVASAATAFLCGYLIVKVEDYIPCDICLAPLRTNSSERSSALLDLIRLQDRGRLHYPSDTENIQSNLARILNGYLSENPIFNCPDHGKEVCNIIIQKLTAPTLTNYCNLQCKRIKKPTIQQKNRKVLKLN